MKSEHEMIPVLETFLKSKGCEVIIDPGGGDFFDVVVVGPKRVGGIELKLGQPRKAFEQALTRIYYFHWVAVLLPNENHCWTLIDASNAEAKFREKQEGKISNLMRQYLSVGIWHYNMKNKEINILRSHNVVGPRQMSGHTIKMARRIAFYRKQGIPNKIAWGHDRGISLMGFQSPFKTMYGKKMRPDQQLLLEFEAGLLDDEIKKIKEEEV